jgi:hypothetical protein
MMNTVRIHNWQATSSNLLPFSEDRIIIRSSEDKYRLENLTSKSLNTTGWYHQKMSELKTINRDFRDSEINPPNNWSIYWASETLEILRMNQFPCDRIAASVDEGICISFLSKKNKDRYADIEFFNNREILAAKSDRSSKPKVWAVSIDQIEETIVDLREYIS